MGGEEEGGFAIQKQPGTNLFHGHAVLLAPRNGDARVKVIELRCAQRNRLVLLLVNLITATGKSRERE